MSERETSPLIADERALREAVALLSGAPRVALDTEGDGMFRYRARLCTVQLASDAQIAIVDTLAVEARLLEPLFAREYPEKVVHDMAFDARLLAQSGLALENVFDTAIAARFLGLSSTGLSALLARYFAVDLPKHKQQADWGARPLDQESVEYLQNDVRYLLSLRDVLASQLAAKGIEAEVREECRYVLREALAPVVEPSFLSRIKGAAQRPAKERARLYELSRARDEIARELDLPAGRVIASELALRLAQLEGLTLGELERRLSTTARPHAPRLLEALARAEGCADAPREELLDDSRIPSADELARRKRRRELLTGFRTREAEAREVDVQAVLPGHCLTDLTKLSALDDDSLRNIAGFGEVRVARYGERFRRELAAQWT